MPRPNETENPKTDLAVSKNDQLDFFEILDGSDGQSKYSNTIEIYDSLPKYNWTQKQYHNLDEAQLTGSTILRGREYKVVIRPAILQKKGKNVLIYPGTREEVVEDALRKFAVSGQGTMIEDHAGVAFTLSQLQSELKSRGHTYDLNEIKEAILVCRGATLECYVDEEQSVVSSNFFPMVALTTRAEYIKKKGDARCFVAFNPMVTKSIMDLSYRQYNYRLAMSIKSPLARFIYKRMSHYWTGASAMSPYTPSLISFLSQSPRGLSESIYVNARAMTNALNVLINHKVVSDYDEDAIKSGKKLINVRYVIRPHDEFIKMVKAANFHSSRLKHQSDVKPLVGKRRARKPDTTTLDGEDVKIIEPKTKW